MKNSKYLKQFSNVFFVIIIPILFGIIGCNSTDSSDNAERNERVKETKTGLASFYGHEFNGQKTASGRIFNSEHLVAAHPSYPLGTKVRVTNTENDADVTVEIIDRGPTKENVGEGVIIDLSKGAAKKLGMIEDGRVAVKLQVLEWGADKK